MKTNNDDTRIKTGLVFSGGIAKGAYQAGFIRALLQNKSFDVQAVSAASIGTLNGYALCTGKGIKAENLWTSVDISGYRQLYKKLFRGYEIYTFIDDLCEECDRIPIPFYTVCWSPPVAKAQYICLNEMEHSRRRDFLKASVSIAPIMEPITIDGKNYFDGAIIDNTPLRPLLDLKFDLIISVQFDGFAPVYRSVSPSCPILYFNLQDKHGIMDSFCLDKASIERMIAYGYEATDDLLDLLQKKFQSYSKFRMFIDKINSEMDKSKLNGDHIIRRINRLSKLL